MFKRRWLRLLVLLAGLPLGWLAVAQLTRPLAAEAKSQYEDIRLFSDVLALVRKSYVEEVPMQELIYGAIDGMLAALDPHSSFMPPDVYKEMKDDTRGEFGGIGIEITIKDGVLTVVSPIEDTPAYRAGLQAGDQIVKIGDGFTKDMSVMDAVKLMRGPKGSPIRITIFREAFEKPKEFELKREIIKIRSVKARTLEDGYGYVRLAQFQERTDEELAKALKDVRKENGGRLDGLILDLRNNPGGLLEQAVKVTDLFLGKGLIVYTDGREEGSRMEFHARPGTEEEDFPLVVLINSGSASASEIVAGALQDHDRALVLGTQSFGKGSVQTVIPLSDDSGLRLTTARYYTPNGTSIQARGITPDIVAAPAELKKVVDGEAFREKDLSNHFDTEPLEAQPKDDETARKFDLKSADRDDYQLMRALDLLKGWRVFKDLKAPAA